ncbi:MAG TPA: tetratricopeptide repeat protein [Chitinophagaceae bacterium]|nr:tetratricopeptide repeat protein [Chitinophagaceae bacterium]
MESSYHKEELSALLQQYEDLKTGKKHTFLEEEAFERIIDYFDDVEDLPKALEAARLATTQFPYSSMLMIKKADLLIAMQQYHRALEILDKAALFDNNDINIYILKTDAYLALDQQDKAVDILEQALHLFEGEERIELLFDLADVYDNYEVFDKVFDCLKLILEQDVTNEEALHKICFWTDFTGRNEESIRLHTHIIDEHPYNVLAWFNLAAAYQGLKLYEKAIDAYQYAIVIDEKFDYAYRNMADAYIRLRKYKEAIEALEKVLELSRPEELIYEAIGHCYHKLNQFAKARFHYKKAIHISPYDSKLYYKIACTYMGEQHWQSAIKQLEAAMRIHRLRPDYSLAIGQCYMQLEQYKEAVQYFGNVVSIRPKGMAGWNELIRCLYVAGYYAEALKQSTIAIKATQGKPIFLFYMAITLLKMNKRKEALLKLEEALQQSPQLVKKIIQLDSTILQNNRIVALISRYKKRTH